MDFFNAVVEAVWGCFEVVVTMLTYLLILVGVNILAINDAWFRKAGFVLLVVGNVVGFLWLLMIGKYLAAVFTLAIALSCYGHYRIQRRSG